MTMYSFKELVEHGDRRFNNGYEQGKKDERQQDYNIILEFFEGDDKDEFITYFNRRKKELMKE